MPIQTELLRGLRKRSRRNRNRDSCEKSATGAENTGILRIPVGITNLDLGIPRKDDMDAINVSI